MDFYLYMGLEVGGCSLFADPSGYVGRRTPRSSPRRTPRTWVGQVVEDGAVGWSCKCSSGRHCRRIGGHRSRDRARPSCSLCHRGYSQTARRRGQDTRVAALEFCVHGIVVHLRLGRDQRSSELTGNVFNPYWQGMCGPFGLFSVRVATSWAHRVHPSSAVTVTRNAGHVIGAPRNAPLYSVTGLAMP